MLHGPPLSRRRNHRRDLNVRVKGHGERSEDLGECVDEYLVVERRCCGEPVVVRNVVRVLTWRDREFGLDAPILLTISSANVIQGNEYLERMRTKCTQQEVGRTNENRCK